MRPECSFCEMWDSDVGSRMNEVRGAVNLARNEIVSSFVQKRAQVRLGRQDQRRWARRVECARILNPASSNQLLISSKE